MTHRDTMTHAPTGDWYCSCRLPDGRIVDLMTNQGADAFVSAAPAFLQNSIEDTLDPIRARIAGTNPNPGDAQMLIQTYSILVAMADNTSPRVFAKMIASDHMNLWVKHVAKVLQELTADPRWILTGVLARHDQKMLDCLTPTSKHYGMVQCMLATKFLHILANFIQARLAPQMPCAEVAEVMCAMTRNIQIWLERQPKSGDGVENVTAADQSFRKLESSGLLAQTLRCLTVPQATTPDVVSRHLVFLDNLIEQSVQMRRKFKPSSPTGAILQAIIKGQDGHPHCPRDIMQRLKSLAQVLDYAARPPQGLTLHSACCFCNKKRHRTELLACSRCKSE
jgi:hypothetical protein